MTSGSAKSPEDRRKAPPALLSPATRTVDDEHVGTAAHGVNYIPMDRFALDRAVQEMWDIHGSNAFKAAIERAQAAERLGQAKLAEEWREIAQACRAIKGDPPSKN